MLGGRAVPFRTMDLAQIYRRILRSQLQPWQWPTTCRHELQDSQSCHRELVIERCVATVRIFAATILIG